MDVLTHAAVPYAAALWWLGLHKRDLVPDRAKLAWAAVFGLAGFAPDLDGAYDWVTMRWDALYWLQHRGMSHTFWGAPLHGLFLMGALALMARVWPRRMGLFAFRPALVLAAVLGAWTHLALDAVTYTGVPLWWPFSWHRVSLQLYHWIVWWMFPVAGFALALHIGGKLDTRRMAQAGVVLVTILVVVGGMRLQARPTDLPEGSLVYPRASEAEWTVLVPAGEGAWLARLYERGSWGEPMLFERNVTPEAEPAVARAYDTDAWRGLRMEAFGPVIETAAREGDAWNVSLVVVAARYEALNAPRWTPTEPDTEAWGVVTMLVRDDGDVEVLARGW